MSPVSSPVAVATADPARAPMLREPVEVQIPAPAQGARVRTVRVGAVVPCFNRRGDAEALLSDLERVETAFEAGGARGRVELRVLLVDNASDVPLSTLACPAGVHLEHLRLPTNTGGSGGYNAGMELALGVRPSVLPPPSDRDGGDAAAGWAAFDADYLWLVDSDARVAPDTLRTLLEVLETRADVVAAGSALLDPLTGQAFELGGHVNAINGNFEPNVIGSAGVRGSGEGGLIDSDYLAACCALVRAQAVRDVGVFPHRFLNGDDVEWFIRMKRITGGRIVGVPWSRAMHPRFDRFPTWTRYYMTRNAFGPVDAVGAPALTRFWRAVREVPRAVQQEVMGRSDLARLHILGLRDAAAHDTIGVAGPGVVSVARNEPLPTLAGALTDGGAPGGARPRTAVVLPKLLVPAHEREQITAQLEAAGIAWRFGRPTPGVFSAIGGMLVRLVTGPRADVAVVPARGRPDAWFLGRTTVEVVPGGFVLRRTPRARTLARAARTGLMGLWHAAGVGRRGPEPFRTMHALPANPVARARPSAGPSVAAVVLSHNRWPALESTLRALLRDPVFAAGSGNGIVVVDNASTDGTPDRVEAVFPGVRLLRFEHNLGVEAFNRGVKATGTDLVLILDDDARPEEMALRRAIELLARRPDLGAVTLHPRHPRSAASEWRFAERPGDPSSDRWPVMGCANLVRRSAWDGVGGYEAGYFLYRNDADLALKLLDAGLGVHFNPNWVVWHDSPAVPGGGGGGGGGAKSARWHRLATRNWLWTARRHGRGVPLVAGGVLGWLWAHRLAGTDLAKHRETLRGAVEGLRTAPPPVRPAREGAASDGAAWRALLGLQLGSRRSRRP